MKSRATLTLMELLVMVLVFSLAAAVCLRLFAGAANLSQETARQDRAVVLAQNAAESLKAGKDPVLSEEELEVSVTELDSGIPGLKQVQITVFFEEEILFTLQTGWQEVGQG